MNLLRGGTMMRKKLSKSEYRLLLTELNNQKDRGIITKQQVEDMTTFYEEREGMNFIRILVTIGAILIGLGVLSFIASNWDYVGKVSKVMIIIAVLGGSIFTSFKVERNYPKTSKAMMYLSSLIYGAGIFLMGQIFNYGGEFTGAFLLWTIGVLLVGWIVREKILFIFAHILFLVYMNGSFGENIIIYSIVLISIFYIGNKYFSFSKAITFFNNLVALNFVLYFLKYLNVEDIYIATAFFIVGLIMYYTKHALNLDIFKLQGVIVLGVSGIFLTFENIWETLYFISDGNVVAIGFGVVLLIYLLSLVKNGLLTPLVFTCILILRYYFDTLYDFMPKSMFFIIGGLIILGFGHYFERIRSKSGGDINEKNKQ